MTELILSQDGSDLASHIQKTISEAKFDHNVDIVDRLTGLVKSSNILFVSDWFYNPWYWAGWVVELMKLVNAGILFLFAGTDSGTDLS